LWFLSVKFVSALFIHAVMIVESLAWSTLNCIVLGTQLSVVFLNWICLRFVSNMRTILSWATTISKRMRNF
jgi:hypothetical protein